MDSKYYDIKYLKKYKGIDKILGVYSIENFINKFSWILNSHIEKAVIGVDKNGTFCWYDGIWHNGVWESGRWEGGTWFHGIWNDGYWVDGIWHSGEWRQGGWIDGKWLSGKWKSGYWLGGNWYNGFCKKCVVVHDSYWGSGKVDSLEIKESLITKDLNISECVLYGSLKSKLITEVEFLEFPKNLVRGLKLENLNIRFVKDEAPFVEKVFKNCNIQAGNVYKSIFENCVIKETLDYSDDCILRKFTRVIGGDLYDLL